MINAAAYTAVDRAEEERERAFAVNCDGAANLATACLKENVPLIHLSTDYVFNGNANRPYSETDCVSPLGAYGESKAAGEREVRKILSRHIIVRTAWLCGLHGGNFVKTMLRLGKSQKEVRVVADQYGCPTFAFDLADALLKILIRLGKDPHPRWGVYHYCGAGITTWYEFAVEIFRLARRYDDYPARLSPISTEDFPTPAQRPFYSVLECTRIQSEFGVQIHPWRERLAEMLDRLFE